MLGLVKPQHNSVDVERLHRYAPGIEILECDLRDHDLLVSIISEYHPSQIFNFGGISSITESIQNPELTWEVNVGSVEAIISGIRDLTKKNSDSHPKLVTAASGTIFEGVDRSPQNEGTEPSPHSPYAQTKSAVIQLLREVRSSENLFLTSAILYNHESPLRGENFVTRKISKAVARIAAGQQSVLELGDIEVARDWGWAPDYVKAMRLMLTADRPADYVLATGISHRLSYFIKRAFTAVGIHDWSDLVVSTESNQRNTDTNLLVGDSRRAYLELGWRHTVDFDQMVTTMVEYDQLLLKDPNALWSDDS